jgi:signal transduction histidine kinase
VTVRAEAVPDDPGMLRVTVTDTGCGIEAEDQERIFDHLYQGTATAELSRKGLGIGLSVCRDLVTRQGGRIWVESQPGRGSEFFLRCPCILAWAAIGRQPRGRQ